MDTTPMMRDAPEAAPARDETPTPPLGGKTAVAEGAQPGMEGPTE